MEEAVVPTRRWLTFAVAQRDEHRWLTLLALAGLATALGMALFGLPPVDLHGPLHRMGIMDPLCGGTRAARFTARGQLGLAWKYNPLGIAAVFTAALVAMRTTSGALFGRWLTVSMHWTPRRRNLAIAVAITLLALLEVRQQLIADLLTAPR